MDKAAICQSPFLLGENPPVTFNDKLRSAGLSLVSKFSGLDRCHQLYRLLEHDGTLPDFVGQTLKTLDINYNVISFGSAAVPATGPCILIANHPYGGIEGVILIDLVSRIRPDFMVMGNHLLGRLQAFADHLIAVDPFGGSSAARTNITPLRRALRCLENKQLLIIFPAGEVSCHQSKKAGVVDPPWSDSLARIVRRSKAPVLPVFFPGHNGALFQLAGKIHPRLRTALLPRMLLEQRHRNKMVLIGQLISSKVLTEIPSDRELTDYLRLRTYALGVRAAADTKTATSSTISKASLISSPGCNLLQREIDALPKKQMLVENEEFQVAYATAGQIPWLLNEIGRLRELTFRQVGEGTGQPCDLDRFDEEYMHLFLWHKGRQEIAGAYRIGHIDHLLDKRGNKGLYTSTLFAMKPALLQELRQALELGRSFVRPEYQRSFAPLLMLWKGIGQYLTLFPKYRYLFGPVSISRDYSSSAKQLMTSVLSKHYRLNELASLVKPRTPVTFKPQMLAGLDLKQQSFLKEVNNLSVLVSDMEQDGKGIPVLLRHYLNLGGQILAFNRDPEFSDVIDGLLLIDLLKADKKQLQRYIGKDGYAEYLAYHSETRRECA